MPKELSEDQIAEVKECFSVFDRKGDGTIEPYQVGDVLRSLGVNPLAEEIDEVEDELGEGAVSLEDFLPFYADFVLDTKRELMGENHFLECFKAFDSQGTGYMSEGQLRHMLLSLGDKMTIAEVDEMLKHAAEKDGEVKYADLIQVIMSQ